MYKANKEYGNRWHSPLVNSAITAGEWQKRAIRHFETIHDVELYIEFKKAHRGIHQSISSMIPALELLRDNPFKVIDNVVYLRVPSATEVDYTLTMLNKAIELLHGVLESN